MPTLTPTYDTGGTAKSMEAVSVDPIRNRPPDEKLTALEAAGLNSEFVQDFLSQCLAHERCGVHLYRVVAGRTNNPMLMRRYKSFGDETLEHVRILEELIESMGGDPQYVSPAARATEKANTGLVESTFMLSGSIDILTEELIMLEAVVLAETKDHANWEALEQIANALADDELSREFRHAVAKVRSEEDDHLMWAQTTRSRMVMLQSKSSTMTSLMGKTEEMMATVRSWFDGDG